MLEFFYQFPWFRANKLAVIEPIAEQVKPAWIVIDIERLVLWKTPWRSFLSLLVSYLILGCVYWAARQPVYSFSLFVLVVCSRDLWKNYIWPEISVPQPSSDALNPLYYRVELGSQIQNECQRLKMAAYQRYQGLLQLRNTNQLLFCGIMSLGWLSLAIIGSLVPGWFLALLLPMALFLLPRWFLQGVPPYVSPVIAFLDALFSAIEKQLGIISTGTPGDEIGLPSSLPLMDLDESDQEVKELEEHIRLRSLKQVSQEEDTFSDDLEEEFSHGLSFTTPPADPRLTQRNEPPGLMIIMNEAISKAATQSSLYNVVAVGQTLLSNYLQSAQEGLRSQETEEGFEIISEDDLID